MPTKLYGQDREISLDEVEAEHIKQHVDSPIEENKNKQLAKVTSTVQFRELGLTVAQIGAGDDKSLLVTNSSELDSVLVVGRQLISINDLNVWSYQQLEEGVQNLSVGQEVKLEFYISELREQKSYRLNAQPNAIARNIPQSNSIDNRYPSQDYHNAQVTLRAEAVKNGYVYKNENYWISYPSDYVREVFEGSLTGYHIDSPLVVLLTRNYLNVIQNQCKNLLGNDPVPFQMTRETSTFYGDGSVQSETDDLGEVLIKRRFAPIYAYYYAPEDRSFTIAEGIQGAYEIANTPLTGAGGMMQRLNSKLVMINSAKSDIGHLFSVEACDSAVIKQFEENLYRLSVNTEAIQMKPMSFENAAFVTDDIFKPGSAKNLGASCYASNDFNGQKEWCMCQGAFYEKYLTDEQIAPGLTDFPNFSRRMEGGLITGSNEIYSNMRRQCVVR